MKEITQRQREVLNFISDFIKENGFPPTVREIGVNFDISLRAVQDHIAALQKKGFLSQSQKRARSISVLVDSKKEGDSVSVRVPIMGNISVAEPIMSEENFDGSLNLVEPFVHGGKSYFAIRVRGNSMKDAGILEGDFAVVELSSVAVDGQIVVALIDGAITIKRFYKETGRVRLQPENPEFSAIYSDNVKILGILSSIIRQY